MSEQADLAVIFDQRDEGSINGILQCRICGAFVVSGFSARRHAAEVHGRKAKIEHRKKAP